MANFRGKFHVDLVLRVAIYTLLNEWWTLVSANVNMFADQTQFKGVDATIPVFGRDSDDIFPVAYADINGDKLTDLITVSMDRTSIDIFLAHDQPPYLRRSFVSTPIQGGTDDKTIVSVRPGDFTGNGFIDLMVTLARGHYNHSTTTVTLGNEGKHKTVDVLFCQILFDDNRKRREIVGVKCPGEGPGSSIVDEFVQEPMTIDLNGDMVLDLVGEVWGVGNLTQRSIWIADMFSEGSKPSYAFKWKRQQFRPTQNENYLSFNMITPSSNAYADLDENSVPELMVLTAKTTIRNFPTYFAEAWDIEKDETGITFKLKGQQQLEPPHQTQIMGQPIVIDLEHTGRLVHLVPYCLNVKCNTEFGIYLLHQDQAIPLPLGTVEYDGMPWHFVPPQSSKNGTASNNLPNNYKMEWFYSQALSLRVGDYNLDGYPDLLGVLKNKQDGENYMTRAVLFENVACQASRCPSNRTFAANFDLFREYTNVISASFFDIGENGVLDVILVTQRQSSQTAEQNQRFEIKAVENVMNFDASFIKVMVLTGQTCDACESGIPYGNALPGASVKYRSLNSQGELESGIVVQTYRTAHMPLDLPCEVFGIGQSPNFVEDLRVTIGPSESEFYFRDWLQIIPNSQIVVYPNPVDRPNRWVMKLFLTPSDAVLKTFGILVAIGFVFASMTAALEWKERREDRKARQSEAHRLVMY